LLAANVYRVPARARLTSSFRDAPPGAGPESITPDHDYGFRARASAPRNDEPHLHSK
jgi:hypothetical protein